MRQNVLYYAAKRIALCGKMWVYFAAKWWDDLRQNGGTICGKTMGLFTAKWNYAAQGCAAQCASLCILRLILN